MVIDDFWIKVLIAAIGVGALLWQLIQLLRGK
jgi:hypothetical protein